MNTLTLILHILCAVGAGLMAGVFFAFSTFVMQALAKLEATPGMEAMQWINKTVLNPWFLGTFAGTAALCVALIVIVIWQGMPAYALYTISAALLYAIGTFGVTAACNVPLNDALDRLDATNDEGRHFWQDYQERWLFWNHVRTIAATLSLVVFMLALRA
ncbi:MAG: DUF1772 domain-containing protein [Phycisphaerae bacterium]